MHKPVVLRAAAVADVESAIDWSPDEGSPAVASRFVDEVQAAYDHICRHSGTGSPRWAGALGLAGLRAWPLRRFPYLVFYFDNGARLDVWRVLHSSRDIPSWLAED